MSPQNIGRGDPRGVRKVSDPRPTHHVTTISVTGKHVSRVYAARSHEHAYKEHVKFHGLTGNDRPTHGVVTYHGERLDLHEAIKAGVFKPDHPGQDGEWVTINGAHVFIAR